MDNDFIKGMEILIDCKRYVEKHIDDLMYKVEFVEKHGGDTSLLLKEIDKCKKILKGE